MLRDVVAAFLDSVTEREFDAPLLALLAARGFTDVHFLHGAFEFGKDIVAKGPKPPGADVGSGDPATWTLHQFAIQSKAGDMGAGGWREVRPQMDEARLDGLAHPAFDTELPRAGVLVVTGRLKGNAATQSQSYREQEKKRGQPDFEIWDRETLLQWLVDAPEVGLAGTSDGPMLALAGAVDAGTITQRALERHSRSWLPPIPETLTAATTTATERQIQLRRASVEAAVLTNRLRRNARLDLAAMVALMLMRAAWSHHLADNLDVSARPPLAVAGLRLFAACALELLEQVAPVAGNPRALLDNVAQQPFQFATYPVVCARIAEVLGLLALLEQGHEPELLAGVTRRTDFAAAVVVQTVLVEQPGCAHPIGDSFATGMIAPVLAVARQAPAVAAGFLERLTVWIADRYDATLGGIGLAGPLVEPHDEVELLFSGPYDHGPPRRNLSYLATIVLDLAAALPGEPELYRDVLNDFTAVDLVTLRLAADEAHAQWRPDGPGARLFTPAGHGEERQPGQLAAEHHREPLTLPVWDTIALASVVRNRHHAGAIIAYLASNDTDLAPSRLEHP